jgi:hypothetical protein
MCERLKRVIPLIFLPQNGTSSAVQGVAIQPPQDFERNVICYVERIKSN